MATPHDMDIPRLHKIGYSLKCCGLCEHGRFYEDGVPDKRKAIPVHGFCARYTEDPYKPLRIHRNGHCRKGFVPHLPSLVEAGVSGFQEFLK